MQQVTALAIRASAPPIAGRSMDITQGFRYDFEIGAEQQVGFLRDGSDEGLVRIELRIEIPGDVIPVVLDREACQPVQVEYACHK